MRILFALLAFVSTLLGGLVSLKYRDKLHLILGFTAGVLLAVVAFDILPEIIRIVMKTGGDPTNAMIALISGFLLFNFLEKELLIHHAQEEAYGEHHHPSLGVLSALALSGHSFLDGVGIGLGFEISSSVGTIVAVAIIAHDFSDGLNTASLMTMHGNKPKSSFWYVVLDAVTPILGAASTLLFKLPSGALVLYLGFFAGFLLCIGAAQILPEAHSPNPTYKPMIMTLIGVLFIYVVSRLI
jgi:ZIP family zinc transporter